MKIALLRGKADRPNYVAFDNIEDDDDMWTQLLYAMCGKEHEGVVYYWGGDRKAQYKPNFIVRWKSRLDNIDPSDAPDVIIARGGFEEYDKYLEARPRAIKIYYGAGKRFMPCQDFRKYDAILADSDWQKRRTERHYPLTIVWPMVKPAAENVFKPVEVARTHDVLFSAIHPGDDRKQVEWVYDTCPKKIRVLQVGETPKHKPPNVTVRMVPKAYMPRMICKCALTIAPYTHDDSAPRIIPESWACGRSVVAPPDLSVWWGQYQGFSGIQSAGRKDFWDVVRRAMDSPPAPQSIVEWYKQNCSLAVAADNLRRLIHACESRRPPTL